MLESGPVNTVNTLLSARHGPNTLSPHHLTLNTPSKGRTNCLLGARNTIIVQSAQAQAVNKILLSVYCIQWSNFMANYYRSPSYTRQVWRYRNRFQNIITVIVRYHHCTLSDFVMSRFSWYFSLYLSTEI